MEGGNLQTNPSLLDLCQQYGGKLDGSNISDVSSLQNRLRGKITTGILSCHDQNSNANAPITRSTGKEESALQGKEKAINSISTYDSKEKKVPVLTVSSEPYLLNPNSNSFVVSDETYFNSHKDVIGDVLSPLSTHNDTLMKEKTIYSTVQVGLCNKGTIRLVDIPQNTTVLRIRDYIVTEEFFEEYPSLNGWRLTLGDVILADEKQLYEYHLQNGDLLSLLPVAIDENLHILHPHLNPTNTATEKLIFPSRPSGIPHYYRSIEISQRISQEENAIQMIQREERASVSEVQQTVEVKEDYFPKLRREGYFMRPSHFEMASLKKEEVEHIASFAVGKEGIGEIEWEGETDVTNLDLDTRVVIDVFPNGTPYFQVYPPELYLTKEPPVGCELNKRATVILYNMLPAGVRSEAAVQRYCENLRKQVKDMGGEWISYDSGKGKLQFIVNHF